MGTGSEKNRGAVDILEKFNSPISRNGKFPLVERRQCTFTLIMKGTLEYFITKIPPEIRNI